jgi:hypothetical protein
VHKLSRTALLPLLAITAVLATGCSAGGPAATESAGRTATPGVTEAAAAQDQLAVVPAPVGKAVATAVARPAQGERKAEKSALKVLSYNRKSGQAVISGSAGESKAPASPSASPASPTATPSTSPSDAPQNPENSTVAVGDILASAPSKGAPDGVLAEVTDVVGHTEDGTKVETEPATLSALLGDSKADGQVPVDPANVEVEPLVEGVKVSWAKTGGLHFGPQGAKLPLGSLRIDVGASVATPEDAPASAAASVKGFVQLAPEVKFFYDGSGSGTGESPGSAFLGLTGDWSSKWLLKGRAAVQTTDGKPLRIPFAKLHTDPVIQVGPVPIVVNLGLTAYFQVDGDGRMSVEVEQDLKGDFRVGGNFSWAKGWQPVSESKMTGEPLRTSVTAAGKVKAALGAEATVGLYGTVGVTADFAPYLRGEAASSTKGAAKGKGSAVGKWRLYGGFDLSGSLRLQLCIFGTPIFQHRIPLGALHKEWKLAQGKGTAAT